MKTKGVVFNFFTRNASSSKEKMPTYSCQFCKKQYALHATRMVDHLIKKCKKCPKKVINQVKKDIKNPDNQQSLLKLQNRESPQLPPSSYPPTPSNDAAFSPSPDIVDIDADSVSTSTPTNRHHVRSSESSEISRVRLGFLDSFVDHTTDSEQRKIWKAVATAIYASGTPLSITENEYWIKAFKLIRPSLTLPSRYMLSNSLLEEVCNEVSTFANALISNATFIGVQCDCWTNIRNESIMNFIITTPKPVFFKTLATKEERHTGEYMHEQLSQIFEEVGAQRIIGCVTDNARNMTKAWELLAEKYSDFPISYYGCASHILNLLMGDIAKLQSVGVMLNSAKSIVKTVKNKLVLTATFTRIQKEKLPAKEIQSLKLPVATRWASVMLCLESLKMNKSVLQTVAITEVGHNELDKNDRKNILDDDVFWIKVEKFLSLLQPIKKWINIFQSDQSRISEVVEAFYEIRNHFETEVPNSPLLINEENKAIKAVEERERMCLKPIHFAANILDPKFRGKNLTCSNCNDGLQYIYKLASSSHIDGVEPGEIFKNVAEYRSGSGFFAMEFVKVSMENKSISPIDFWRGICTDFPLRKIAEALLTMPPTSAATERSFSAQGFIHSKKRNRLETSRAGKLTYVHHNLNLLAEKKIRKIEEISFEGAMVAPVEVASTAREKPDEEEVEESTDSEESETTDEELRKEMVETLHADSDSSELDSDVENEN